MKPLFILLAAAAVVAARAEESVPFTVDFSSGFTVGPLHGQAGWTVDQGEAFVRLVDGAWFVEVPASRPFGQISRAFARSEPLTYVGLTMKLAAIGDAASEFVDSNGSLASLVRVDGAGRLFVRHEAEGGVPTWLPTRSSLPLDGVGVTANWVTLLFRQDYSAGTWDLYVDGRMMAADIRMQPDDRVQGDYLTILGQESHPTLLKGVSVSKVSPLGDADGDGLPDLWQKDLSAPGRYDDADGDGLLNLEELVLGTDPSEADTDGDGSFDGDEMLAGNDPLTSQQVDGNGMAPILDFWAGSLLKPLPDGLFATRRERIFSGIPSSFAPLSNLEHWAGLLPAEDFAARVRGYLTAPRTGKYTFWVSGDDEVQFFLSDDDAPFLKREVARTPGWTDFRSYDSFPSQRSSEVTLSAGQRYYFEVQLRGKGAPNHFSVAWKTPGGRRSLVSREWLDRYNPVPLDADDNGLPDAWERSTGVTYFAGDEYDDDADKDRLPDLMEFRLGSNPRLSDSAGRAGLIERQIWFGIPGRYLFDRDGSSLPLNPFWTEYLERFEAPRDVGSDFVARMRASVSVPVTGTYRFAVSGDDECELLIATDGDRLNAVRVAHAPLVTGVHDWNRYPSQVSAPIALSAGQTIWVEAVHKQGGGDSHLSVAWKLPGADAFHVIDGSSAASPSMHPRDQNGDDLPDAWQTERGMLVPSDSKDAGRFSAHGDADGDGVTNRDELAAGTNPKDALSWPAGGLTWEIRDGIPGTRLTSLATNPAFPGPVSRLRPLRQLAYQHLGNDYVSRARGFLVPPVTGTYTFHLMGDDNCEFWLSSGESRFGKNLVAAVTSVTPWRHKDWNSRQQSGPVTLEAGRSYYIEVRHKQGKELGHFALSWDVPEYGASIIQEPFLRPLVADPADADDDGLPDAWEAQNGLDARAAVGGDGEFGDPDRDLLDNFAEYRRGTDPLVADSARLPGSVTWQKWEAATGSTVHRLTRLQRFPASPDQVALIPSTEAPQDLGAWYGGRMRGYIIPSASGPHHFLLASDDQSTFLLSPGEGKFARKQVATVPFYTGEREWDRFPTQRSEAVLLEAGQKYYFEVLHKEDGGRDHAALAWKQPGSPAPVVINGANIESYGIDTNDLDDDELPDDWELRHELDVRDNGTIQAQHGPWGDPDHDGLANIDELAMGTSPRTADSDEDGLSDEFEVNVTGTNPLVRDSLHFSAAAASAGLASVVTAGSTEDMVSGRKTASRTGKLNMSFTLPQDGLAWFRLSASLVPQSSDAPLGLVVAIDGIDLGSFPLIQLPLQPGSVSGRLPYLKSGVHTMTFSWAISEADKALLFQQLAIFTLPAGNVAQDTRNALAPGEGTSLVSPVCFEGTATFPQMVSVTPATPVAMLPDRGWFSNVELPESGSAVTITASFENGRATASRTVAWKAVNLLESGDLIIRPGDSLRLTAFPPAESAPAGTAVVSIAGEAGDAFNPAQPVVHTFPLPGTYAVEGVFAQAQGEAQRRTINVRVVGVDVPDAIHVDTGMARELTLPGVASDVTVFPDSSLFWLEHTDSVPRSFTVSRPAPGSTWVAFRLPTGPVVQSVPVEALWLASDMETYYGLAASYPDGTTVIEMDVFMPKRPPGFRIRIDIIVAGVTFEDGSLSMWLTEDDFDAHGVARVRFVRAPGVATSFCHEMTLFDGDVAIGTR